MSTPSTPSRASRLFAPLIGVTALLLALAYRSWQLTRDDEVENDVADTLVARGELLGRDVADEVVAGAEVEDAEAMAEAVAGEVDG